MATVDVSKEVTWLISEIGSVVATAKALNITVRWVDKLKRGEGKAGVHLAKEIIRQCRKRR